MEERGSSGASKNESSFSPESSTRLPTPVYMSSNESNPGDSGVGSKASPVARRNPNAATAAKHAALGHVRRVQGHSFLRATAALTDLKRSAPNLVGNALELGGLSPSALSLKLRLTGHARSKKLYCDCCTRHIWDLLQEWFVCVGKPVAAFCWQLSSISDLFTTSFIGELLLSGYVLSRLISFFKLPIIIGNLNISTPRKFIFKWFFNSTKTVVHECTMLIIIYSYG